MLGSITPLGERSRNGRWGVTVGAYLIGSTLGGALTGAALGGLGSVLPVPSGPARLGTLAAAAIVGLAFDLGLAGLRLPTVHRQVNQEWLVRYRGWVYGLGFGLQLGMGVVTVVTTSFIYVMLIAALLSGGVTAGAAIAGAFGFVRASMLLMVAGVRRPDQLARVNTSLRRWDARTRRATLAAGAGLAAVLAVEAVRWRS